MRNSIFASSILAALAASSCTPTPGVPIDDTSGSTSSEGDPSTSSADGSSSADTGTTADPTGVEDTSTGTTGTTDASTTDASTTDASTTDASTTDASTTDASTTDTSATDVSATDVSSTDASSTDTGVEPECGNGIVEDDEACDDMVQSATCDADCTLADCGDATINPAAGELCEVDDLAGATCALLGLPGAGLACAPDCAGYDTAGCVDPPGAPVLALGFSAIKQFDFSWAAVADADHYQLEESVAPGEPFVQIGGDVVGTSISVTMPLHLRPHASYRLRACNPGGCTASAEVDVTSSLAEAVGYFKASNTGAGDRFGIGLAISADGNTLAVGARREDSNATGIGGDQANALATDAGAVYVFVRDGSGAWSQQAYIKASNTESQDVFGVGLSLSGDGSTLAVGALGEESLATGIGGDQTNNGASAAGAVYVFVRDGAGAWSQQAYVKASNTGGGDSFGFNVLLSADGDTLAVGASGEDSSATGIDGDQADDAAPNSGAVYVFVRDGLGAWSQAAYVKASNTESDDYFGHAVALSGDGDTLAVGAYLEDGSATGIDGDQAAELMFDAGAVYVFVRDGLGAWSQQAYVKASNTDPFDYFGVSVALSGDGNTLAVGAQYEDGSTTGIGGDDTDDSANARGATYVFVRDGLGTWSQSAYVKASSPPGGDLEQFGFAVTLSADGDTLAVCAPGEDGNGTGIDGDQANDAATDSGAVYVLRRDGGGAWSQASYVKPSNTSSNDNFGWSMALSGDGSTLAVGSQNEDGSAVGIGGDQASEAAANAGAVYLY